MKEINPGQVLKIRISLRNKNTEVEREFVCIRDQKETIIAAHIVSPAPQRLLSSHFLLPGNNWGENKTESAAIAFDKLKDIDKSRVISIESELPQDIMMDLREKLYLFLEETIK